MIETRRGFRKLIYSKTGVLLYESSNTPAKWAWDFLERTILPVRSRDIVMSRFPGKHIWDMLSLAQITLRKDLNGKQKLNCLKFYFDAGGINNLFATFHRSGSRWVSLTLDLALDLANGGKGEYHLDSNAWFIEGGIHYSKFDWRTPAGVPSVSTKEWNVFPVYFHTHNPYHRTRCMRTKDMKTVILVRSILESLESIYFKQSNSSRWPEVTLDDEDSFPWDRYVDDGVEFYNSWGDAMQWHRNCLLVRYNEVFDDPVNSFQAISDHWDLGLPRECIERALELSSKSAMKKKLEQGNVEENIRVSFRKERGHLSKERSQYILDRLQKELIHDLGVDYSQSHNWGRQYDS